MTSPPGELTAEELTQVEYKTWLATKPARAYRRARVAFAAVGKNLIIVDRFSAYRSAALQNAMRAASLTPVGSPEREYYKLASYSTVPLAAHPNGSHEDGRCMDVLINGSDNPSQASIDLLKKYGWIQQFGSRDRNHFQHDLIHATTAVSRAWCIEHGLFLPS